jgi:hypothetical protein
VMVMMMMMVVMMMMTTTTMMMMWWWWWWWWWWSDDGENGDGDYLCWHCMLASTRKKAHKIHKWHVWHEFGIVWPWPLQEFFRKLKRDFVCASGLSVSGNPKCFTASFYVETKPHFRNQETWANMISVK